MNAKISVIIPVYNVEKYLKRCVDSVIRQTYQDLEIILIDDGATDKSGEICDYYRKVDSRIQVIHQANGGLSEARNSGISISTGKYITFIDSDDYVDERMIEILLENLLKAEADISICSNKRFSGEFCTNEKEKVNIIKLYSSQEALYYLHGVDGPTFTVAWGKLYKREIFDNLRYPSRKLNEDEFITYKALDQAEKIVFTSMPLYYYFQNDKSITSDANYLKSKDIYEALDERIKYFKERNNEEIAALAYKAYIDRIILRYRKMTTLGYTKSIDLQELRLRYNHKYKERKNKLRGIGYSIFYISPSVYFRLLKVKEFLK